MTVSTEYEFQPTRPCGARHKEFCGNHSGFLCFNPRARAGRDTSPRQTLDVPNKFQPTRPCGARRFFINLNNCACNVSTHAPVRGATGAAGLTRRPRFVSTHAPVRGATDGRVVEIRKESVSTHAPVRGATSGDTTSFADRAIVSTHAPVRGATRRASILSISSCVSTHAPVRGATKGLITIYKRPKSFNPRARAGRDLLS